MLLEYSGYSELIVSNTVFNSQNFFIWSVLNFFPISHNSLIFKFTFSSAVSVSSFSLIQISHNFSDISLIS